MTDETDRKAARLVVYYPDGSEAFSRPIKGDSDDPVRAEFQDADGHTIAAVLLDEANNDRVIIEIGPGA